MLAVSSHTKRAPLPATPWPPLALAASLTAAYIWATCAVLPGPKPPPARWARQPPPCPVLPALLSKVGASIGPCFWRLRSVFHPFIYPSFNMNGSCHMSGAKVTFQTIPPETQTSGEHTPEPLRKMAACGGAAVTPPVKTPRGERKPTFCVPALKCLVASTLL